MTQSAKSLKILNELIKSSSENGDLLLLSNHNRNILKKLLEQIKRIETSDETYDDFKVEFGKNILNITEFFPIEVLWWLQSIELVYLNTYVCYKPDECKSLPGHVVDLLCYDGITADDNEVLSIDVSPARTIGRDMLIELLIACEGPKITFSNDSFSKWRYTSDEFVASIINQCIQNLLHSYNKPCNYLKDIRETKTISESSLRKIYLDHLRLILHNQPCCSPKDAVANQEKWTFENCNASIISLLHEILSNIQNPMDKILEIINEDMISWQWFLTAISICLTVKPKCTNVLTAAVDELITKALVTSSSDKLLTAFLIARQACYESVEKFETYGIWYSKQFGPDSTRRTATKTDIFKFFIKFLNDLIPYESELCLQTHISKSLATPPRCLGVLREFKDIASSRINDFKMKNGKIDLKNK